ncbi:FAD-dependent oxidoreductase [Nocardia huaxiensis]|uniref:FAD-dependent oxidoreductase n=1 Tax=Nocardia huaxiensis TaxID=2755382 RepID=A0A7D6VCD8_9NOCA|nr:FAD-dependent oxidoreductase [Nocardia huaxiensis]QLY31731.1 FAD-dependent oxidoreductase [Nocardia huaxiensis]
MSAHVVILGAGYAGLAAAKRLGRANVVVTVVNPRAEFVERIRLHQHVAGTYDATRPLEELLPAGAELRLGSAERIDAERRIVHLGDGGQLEYDYLIYAVGSGNRRTSIPGAGRYAVGLDSWEDAVEARKRLLGLAPGAVVSIVGGGLSGIETAAELSALRCFTVRLVTAGQLGASLSGPGRAKVRAFLAGANVEILEHAEVAEITDGKLVLGGGQTLPSDLTIAVASVSVPDLAARSGLHTDTDGALSVDQRLVSTSSSNIVGAGDSVRLPRPLRMSCQAAVPSGVRAAHTVLALRRGRTPKPVRRKFVGQAVSLGRDDALIQLSTLDDTPIRFLVTGRSGALTKELVCRSTLTLGQVGPLRSGWSWWPGK